MRFVLLHSMALAALALSVRAQFVAFNDHAPGPETGANTTSWDVLGNAPGSVGKLKDSKTGADLPVTLSITRTATGIAGAGTQGSPAPGTPLYAVFNGFVDFQGTPSPSIEMTAGGVVTYTFSGLDPAKSYSLMASAIRGNAPYTDRWTLCELVGPESFNSAHTKNALTSTKVPALTSSQVALDFGVNNTADTGDMAVWQDIRPNAQGTFSMTCRQYTGTVPGGSSGGIKGYGVTGIRLEEVVLVEIPAVITTQPQSQTVNESQPVTFSVTASGSPTPSFQWMRSGNPIAGATSGTYTIAAAETIDNGANFSVKVANTVSNIVYSQISEPAVLTVIADTTPPSLQSFQTLGLSQIRLVFSEPVLPAGATNPANYGIVGGGVNIAPIGAALDNSQTTILLAMPPLTEGASYTLTIRGIKDQSAAGNSISTAEKTFTAYTYIPQDIGTPIFAGGISPANGGYDVSGSGSDIGASRDQFQFAYQQRSGDFDIQVRVADLTITDAYVKAGLMVRDSLQETGAFAGVFASSAELGSFFEFRNTPGTATTLTGAPLKFPSNYPWAWLRLRRSGSTLTGYGSFDAKQWQQFGTATVSLPNDVYFGMAVTSGNTNALATAKFRDLGPTTSTDTFTYVPRREPIGPANRRTGLIFSEIMYRPKARTDGKNLEFVEIFNGEPIFIDLTGWKVTGDVDFTFPDGFQIQSGQFVVLAADPAAVMAEYGISNVLPYKHTLSPNGSLTLLNQAGAVRAKVSYSNNPPWPAVADAAGHSLVCLRPSYGEDDVRAWGPSQLIGGSPGYDDPVVPHPWAGVMINELLAAPDVGGVEFIEIYNASNFGVDLSGCFLTDSAKTNKYRIPDGTRLEPRAWLSIPQTDFGFGLSSGGETIYLVAADQSRVLDAVQYPAQDIAVSYGRSPDGAPTFRALSEQTPGKSNAALKPQEVVINEIMYHPLSGEPDDEYVELYNNSGKAIDLNSWRFTSGIGFSFPSGSSIPAQGYLVVARNKERLLTNYTQLNANNTIGDFSGKLSGTGDHLVLAKPVVYHNETNYAAVSEVTYGVGGRWPELADGGGSSLELKDPQADPLLAANWGGSDETQKTVWKTYEFTGTLGAPPVANQTFRADKLYIIGLQSTECLIDQIEVFRAGSTNLLLNPDFEDGPANWTFYGTHLTSSIDSTGAFSGNNCLHLRATEVGDEGPNSTRGRLGAVIPSNSTVTIRAHARWLSGWPEILLRIRGNGLEFPITLDTPRNPGTPGLPNSRALSNAGPAISEVTHYPPVPAAGQPVLVTARVSDSDGVASVQLVYRLDPDTAITRLTMRDDGTGGDVLAGDGIYSATLAGRQSGTIAFRIEAQDAAGGPPSLFPDNAPTRECIVRWGDAIPFGSIAHYHLWSTAASATDVRNRPGLDRRFRDCTLIYNNRVIYNAGWRNKGSPFHGGVGSYRVDLPADELLLAANSHVFRSTGNGGNEGTQMADDMAYWIAEKLGIQFNHGRYARLYANGALQYPVDYDLEVPDKSIAKDWYGGGGLDDNLYKIAGWFEYDDSVNNGTGSVIWAAFQKRPASGPLKMGAYRFNWLIHPGGKSASDLAVIFGLITAANSSDKLSMMNLADMEQWMRVFAHRRIVGDWDSWSYNTGQNMYLYAPLGKKARLMSWDMDFVLGLGDAASTGLFSAGEDSVIQSLFSVPAYRRMMWRAYQDAANGPLRKEVSDPQFDARRAALQKNNVSSSAPNALKSYVASRRTYILNQAKAADISNFTLTTPDSTTDSAVMSVSGTAPFAVATIEVNGLPFPVTWTSTTGWNIRVPVGPGTNALAITGKDLRGNVYAGTTNLLTVVYNGVPPEPQDWLTISEIMYHPAQKNADFVEIYNRHPDYTFDISGFVLKGGGFTFPPGSFLGPNRYLVVATDSAAFAAAYGPSLPVAGKLNGGLKSSQAIQLIKPGVTADQDLVVSAVRYESEAPWPVIPSGAGVSLQLIDSAQNSQRVANWGVSSFTPLATPDTGNSVGSTLPVIPSLWINEVQPVNSAGLRDSTGQPKPWIEIYNSGPDPVALDQLALANDIENLAQWSFPAGAQISPGEFRVVFVDGQAQLTTATELHAGFKLTAGTGNIILSTIGGGQPQVLDYVKYAGVLANHSYGSFPNGQSVTRVDFPVSTPGAANVSVASGGLQVTVASISGTQLAFHWNTVVGHTYNIEYKDDLGQPGWKPLITGLVATSGSLSSTVDLTAAQHRFIRVLDTAN